MRRAISHLALGLVLALSGCAASSVDPRDPLAVAREAAEDSEDREVVGRAMLLELSAPGGSIARASALRGRLGELDAAAKDAEPGVYATLPRAVDDELHGALESSAKFYLKALRAARTDPSVDAPVLAAYAAFRLRSMRGFKPAFFEEHRKEIDALLADPGLIGHRARTDLLGLHAEGDAAGADEKIAEAAGCVRAARFAGPFGEGSNSDIFGGFPAEDPLPWPRAFPAPKRGAVATVVDAKISRCSLDVEPTAGQQGTYYVETFVTLEKGEDVVLSISGALSVRIADRELVRHDPRNFGTFANNLVAVRLGAGRHRLVARLVAPTTEIRLVDRVGRPIRFEADIDGSIPYELAGAQVSPTPHTLAPWLEDAGVREPFSGGARVGARAQLAAADPALRFLAAALVASDGHHDVATVIAEPLLTEQSRATPAVLSLAASLAEEDPIFGENDALDLAFMFRKEAVEKDARLWYAKLWLLVRTAEKEGPSASLAGLSELAQSFPEVPAIGKALFGLYTRLGYRPEQKRVLADLAKRFPNDLEVARSHVSFLEEEGKRDEAKAVLERAEKLPGGRSIALERALGRGDWLAARAILLKESNDAEGTTKELALHRAEELAVRAGLRRETEEDLQRALQLQPLDLRRSLAIADLQLSQGDDTSLRRAVARAHENGLDPSDISSAIELVEGETDLSPFRIDGLAEIAQFESSGAARAGRENTRGGTAARVLDYAAVWVYRDGSARMLEHEILYMQSSEAIARHAEQRIPPSKLLRIRTIKADGTIYEPELVRGKPTATMPHLSVGDYIETETIHDLPGDGRGERFVSPRWFFREEGVDYQRSEFVVITPKGQDVTVETTGEVPPPAVETAGEVTVRRFRVDQSPALPNEPLSAPIDEFLPSVRLGWGIDESTTLERLRNAMMDLEPADPRIVRVAKTVVTGTAKRSEQDEALAKMSKTERTKKLYRWVLENIEPSKELNARRSIMARSGSPARSFLYLARLLDLDAAPAVVQDKLARPPVFPIEKAERFGALAVVVERATKNETWVFPDGKYTPFGYLPSSLRGQPAVVLTEELPRTKSSDAGTVDGVKHSGTVKLRADGSATFSLTQSYTGRVAIVLRNEIQGIPDKDRLKSALESELLPQALPGARIVSYAVENLESVDEPLVLSFELEIARFARRVDASSKGGLVIAPPFSANQHLSAYFQLEARETPMILPPQIALRTEVEVTVELPKGFTAAALPELRGEKSGASFSVNDRMESGALKFSRVVALPSMRVEVDAYPPLAAFSRTLDDAIHREVVVQAP